MLIDEMHVVVSQGFQKINSSQRDNVLPEEVDLALNLAQDAFVASRLPSRVADSALQQTALYDLRALLVRNTVLPAILETQEQVSGLLPINCRYVLNDRSYIAVGNRGTHEQTSVNWKLAILDFPLDIGNPLTEQYAGLRLQAVHAATINGVPKTTTLFELDKTHFTGGIYDSRERHELLKLVLETANLNLINVQLYWEYFADKYYPNKLICLGQPTNTVPGYKTLRLSWKGVEYNASFQTITNQQYKQLTQERLVLNTPVDQDVYLLQANPYGSSKPGSPLSQQTGTKLYVHEGKDFSVTGIVLDYVRAPRQVNYKEKISSELSPDIHPALCEMAIMQLLRSGAGSPTREQP